MSATVLVIGIDAAESTLIEKWSTEGRMPTFAQLRVQGSVRRLLTPENTLPGAIWPELTSGQSGGRTGRFCTVNQVRPGEARYRPIVEADLDPDRDYWSIASAAGRRVAALDQVHCGTNPKLNGIQLSEWGCHDRNFRTASHPPELLDEINSRYGPYPIRSCDSYPKTYQGYIRLLSDLVDGVHRKTAMLVDLLEREEWDLFTCSFSESHCAGHQLWHLHDTRHHDYDDAAPQQLKNALRTAYSAIDEGVGRLIHANRKSGTNLVFASHGMGPFVGGFQMLPELLARLGMSSDRGTAASSFVRNLQNRMKKQVPVKLVPFLETQVARSKLLRRIQGRFGGMIFPLDSPHTRAAFVPNNRVGGIRLNIKGREPNGCLEPGEGVEGVVGELRRELLELRQVGTGQPIVHRVMTAQEVFGKDHHPGIPDIMVIFRRDLGPLEACESKRVGEVRIPAHNVRMTRTGDHTPESRLWVTGPGEPAGARLPDGDVLDIAPTVLNLLDVSIPPQMDGTPLVGDTGLQRTSSTKICRFID